MSEVPISDFVAGLENAARAACRYFEIDPDERAEWTPESPLRFKRWQLTAEILAAAFRDSLPEEARGPFFQLSLSAILPPVFPPFGPVLH
jgi:hypothetical protein